jgi:hypothetical protein
MKCPGCKTDIKLPKSVAMATCPKCLQTFRAVNPDEEAATDFAAVQSTTAPASAPARPRAIQPAAATAPREPRTRIVDDEDDRPDSGLPPWVNPWGLAAGGAATLALLVATLMAVYWLTLALAVVGAGLAVWGARQAPEERWTQERVWFYGSGALNGLILLLTLFLPGVLNSWWSIDVAPPKRDPNALVVVPRNEPLEEGRPLEAEPANAETEGIRQDDVFVRLESVKVGRLASKGPGAYFLVHFRLTGVGSGEAIKFEGFAADNNRPVLVDDAGRSFGFVAQEKRKEIPGPRGMRGTLVFEEAPAEPVDLVPPRALDLVLVFDSAPAQFGPVRLELPASAWGRQGVCKFRITGPFDARNLK